MCAPRGQATHVDTASPRLGFQSLSMGCALYSFKAGHSLSSRAFVLMSDRVSGELQKGTVNQQTLEKNRRPFFFGHDCSGDHH